MNNAGIPVSSNYFPGFQYVTPFPSIRKYMNSYQFQHLEASQSRVHHQHLHEEEAHLHIVQPSLPSTSSQRKKRRVVPVRKKYVPRHSQVTLLSLREDRFKGKWSDISYNLYCRSDQQFFRTSHNCREMWYNHLNPIVNHDKWTIEEDIELFKLANQLGTKWARISKALNGVRTEHMVKNRFNSISKKYHSRFQRCSTKKMIELIGIHL